MICIQLQRYFEDCVSKKSDSHSLCSLMYVFCHSLSWGRGWVSLLNRCKFNECIILILRMLLSVRDRDFEKIFAFDLVRLCRLSSVALMSFVNFGRLHVIKRLEFADVLLLACSVSHKVILVTWIDLSMAHLETLHSLVHLHITVVDGPVSYLRLGGAPSTAIHVLFRVFLLSADVFDCWVKVLPERFDGRHILSLAHFLVLFTCHVHVMVDVSCELLLVQVVDQSVSVLTLVGLVSWTHLQGWLFVWPVSPAAILILRLDAIVRVGVLRATSNCSIFVNSSAKSFRPLFQPAVSRWYLDGVATRNTDRSVAMASLNRWK